MHLGENAGPSCGHLETLSDHLGAILRCRTGDIQMLAESAQRLGEITIFEVPQGRYQSLRFLTILLGTR